MGVLESRWVVLEGTEETVLVSEVSDTSMVSRSVMNDN